MEKPVRVANIGPVNEQHGAYDICVEFDTSNVDAPITLDVAPMSERFFENGRFCGGVFEKGGTTNCLSAEEARQLAAALNRAADMVATPVEAS